MSILKKLGAVAVGTATVAGSVAVLAVKAAADAAAEKIGNGSFTAKNGRTFTGQDCKNMSRNCEEKGGGLFKKGFKLAGDLWNDED